VVSCRVLDGLHPLFLLLALLSIAWRPWLVNCWRGYLKVFAGVARDNLSVWQRRRTGSVCRRRRRRTGRVGWVFFFDLLCRCRRRRKIARAVAMHTVSIATRWRGKGETYIFVLQFTNDLPQSEIYRTCVLLDYIFDVGGRTTRVPPHLSAL
jgi:hypothetical protein